MPLVFREAASGSGASTGQRGQVRRRGRDAMTASGDRRPGASTHGNQRKGIQIGGKDVFVGVNAYV